LKWALAAIALVALAPAPVRAVTAPNGFVVENAVPGSGFDTPVAIAFLPDGRMFVAEKRGRVYEVQNGVVSPTPLWAGENEVLNIDDRGLLGLAVDPRYFLNHYIYLLYTVDPDSNGVDDAVPSFGRLTRYQVGFADSAHVDPSSRTILMGVDWPHGSPTGSPSHTIGALRFGADGTLLVSEGDGAEFTGVDAGGQNPGLFGAGKTDPSENIGAYRAQFIGSLAGKILRLDPTNGHGLPSNPFWDGNASSVRSRIWAYGLRNPYRFTVRPSTGSANPALGNPGTLYVGDVGWNSYEELNIVKGPGYNFGWPCREGNKDQPDYLGQNAPQPSHCKCDSTLTFHNPSPRREPDLTWHHQWDVLSVPQGIVGNCSVSGAFYTSTHYPPEYQGKLFFCDFGQNWIRTLSADASDSWSNVQSFATDVDGPVDMAANPVNGDLYYVSIYTNEVRRIRFDGDPSNHWPVAVAAGTPLTGQAPLTVTFSSTGTYDPDNDPLTLGWSFGDGYGSTQASPQHTYANPGNYRAILSADDGRGAVGRDTVYLTVTDANVQFPTTPVLDDFDRADGSIGGQWLPELPGLMVSSNSLLVNTSYSSAVWGGGTFGPNQEAFVTFTGVQTQAPESDLMLKVQGTIWSSGYIEVRYDATRHEIQPSTYTPGNGWQARGTPISAQLLAGDRLGARAEANGTLSVFVNGLQVGSTSIADWPYAASGGRLGVIVANAQNNRFDDFGGGDVVYPTNTPPTCSILSPTAGAFYTIGDTIVLAGTASDAQDPAGSLTYRWQVDLHHNNHVHPSSYVFDTPSASFVAENHDDGTGIHLVVLYIVTDKGGLRDTSQIQLFPNIDLQPAPTASTPSQLYSNSTTPFQFALRNLGSMPAGRTHWTAVLDNGTALAAGDTSVAAHDSVIVQALLAPTNSMSVHTLRIVADTLGTLTETSESNNGMERNIDSEPNTSLDVGTTALVLALSSAYPNPSAAGVAFTLELPGRSRVGFDVVDVQGRSIWSASNDVRPSGRWTLRWPGTTRDGGLAPPGVYLARISAGGQMWTRRIALIH